MISPVKIWRNQKKIRNLLGTTGKIISFTVVRVPPQDFENQAPYLVAVVETRKERHVGQLVDVRLNEVKIGQEVTAVLRRVKKVDTEGIIPYGIKWKT